MKQNFGIPATVLCVSAYLLGYNSLWMVIALLVVVFAFPFETKVRKSVVQASGISILFGAIGILLSVLHKFINLIPIHLFQSLLSPLYNGINGLTDLIETVVFLLFAVLAVVGQDRVLNFLIKDIE